MIKIFIIGLVNIITTQLHLKHVILFFSAKFFDVKDVNYACLHKKYKI